jgi:hypothetical protein
MPCHAMHPIQDLFLESFSYALLFAQNFILVKSGCYKGRTQLNLQMNV